MKFTKIECGVPLDGNTNSCFFLSLKEGLRRIGNPACRGGYDYFLSLGEWPEKQRGQMVDTVDHSCHIFLLARALNVRIVIYSEASGNIISDRFGTGPIVRIINLKGNLHYNFLEIDTPDISLENDDERAILTDSFVADADNLKPKKKPVPVKMPKKWASKKTYEGITDYRKRLETLLKDDSKREHHATWQCNLKMSDDELLKVLPIPTKIYTDY